MIFYFLNTAVANLVGKEPDPRKQEVSVSVCRAMLLLFRACCLLPIYSRQARSSIPSLPACPSRSRTRLRLR